jgi:signal transduction histidine kinase
MWADVSAVFVPASGRNSAFFTVVIADITKRKRAEERLHQKEAELAHISRVTTMGELAASIAHEVNQPLAGIVTNAKASLNWLAGDSPNLAEVSEAIRRIILDGHRAADEWVLSKATEGNRLDRGGLPISGFNRAQFKHRLLVDNTQTRENEEYPGA